MAFRRGFEINAKYKFKDDDGLYTFIGITSATNQSRACLVFLDTERHKRRRIRIEKAKELIIDESNS
ncbi:MAG: hypothetical protein ACW97P_13280 [Candidatus Hodarchaeales archaeon]|jgi:hypothetical protein